MSKEIISTSNAPAPIGPYSQAVLSGDILYISGQIALIPGTTDLDNADISNETNRVMKNLGAVLEAASMNFGQVVKTTIYLSDMVLFTQVNEIYGKYFEEFINDASAGYPARETVSVKGLPKNVNVEISMIAIK